MSSKPGTVEMLAWIELRSATTTDVHEFRNLGEDLWRSLREDRRASIDIKEVDRATERIAISLHTASKANLRWLEKFIAGNLERYPNFNGRIAVSILPNVTK